MAIFNFMAIELIYNFEYPHFMHVFGNTTANVDKIFSFVNDVKPLIPKKCCSKIEPVH